MIQQVYYSYDYSIIALYLKVSQVRLKYTHTQVNHSHGCPFILRHIYLGQFHCDITWQISPQKIYEFFKGHLRLFHDEHPDLNEVHFVVMIEAM